MTAVARQELSSDEPNQCSNWTYASMSCTVARRINKETGIMPQLYQGFDAIWPVGSTSLARYLQAADLYGVAASSNGWFGPKYNTTDGYREAFHPSGLDAWTVYEEGRARLDAAILRGDADRWLLHLHVTDPHASYD